MEEKVYLIKIEREYEDTIIVGYFKGTEEKVTKYCEEYNVGKEYKDTVWYEELKPLN